MITLASTLWRRFCKLLVQHNIYMLWRCFRRSLSNKEIYYAYTIYWNSIDILGVCFKKALFVPNVSLYHKVGSHSLPSSESQVDLSWQFSLQRVWENLIQGERGMLNFYYLWLIRDIHWKSLQHRKAALLLSLFIYLL